tara:strand:+ start:366 stop:590 length:225 start_codon:yes stop_codon:yes gene_type:complete
MAIAKIQPPSFVMDKKTFTPDKDIKINSVKNSYLLPLNFKEGDTIEAGTELKFNIDGFDDFRAFPEAIIDYTEL